MFQKKIIDKYLSKIEKDTLSQKYDLYRSIFANEEKQANIRESKEEQYQEGFIRDLFCSCLGYTIKPEANYNILTELKNESKSNAKKSDGAIVFDGEVKAVIELKGTDTQDLDRVAFQAFSYKNHHENCPYVIVSNFERLRVYVETQIEFVEFNLFSLTKEKFDLLFLLLSIESIKNDIPLKLKHETLTEEKEITNSFYTDYSAFKRELFDDLCQNNTGFDKLTLFKKTQKLLDRILFILFCEDRNLLPANSTIGIISDFKKLKELGYYQSLYNVLKTFFSRIDKGFKSESDSSKDIFAYNGGLFKTDEILDSVIVSDDVLLKHCQKLANYDFQSQISVDILGRIFENSLTEIEDISTSLNDHSSNIGKRKKDGVFYTPEYITKYIVENTIGSLCEAKKEELNINDKAYTFDKKYQQKTIDDLDKRLEEYRTWLLGLKILDPACGSGAFLNAALKFLRKEHTLIDYFWSKIHSGELNFTAIDNAILENNLYGVDINEDSVEITKLSLWLSTAQKNRKLTTLAGKIKCGNSLISDKAIAGDKAFDWQKEFPEVFASTPLSNRSLSEVEGNGCKSSGNACPTLGNACPTLGDACPTLGNDCPTLGDACPTLGDACPSLGNACPSLGNTCPTLGNTCPTLGGFDVIIGNPPYVTRNIDESSKHYINENYETAEYQLDLYVCFMERAVKLLKQNGQLGFIVPNSWLKNLMMSKCRKFLLEKFNVTDIVRTKDVFKDASVDTLVYIGNKVKDIDDNIKISDFANERNVFSHFASKSRFLKNDSFIFDIEVNESMAGIFDKVKNGSSKIKDLFDVCRGINPYDKYTGQSEEVIKNKAYHADYEKDETFVPLLQGKHIGRFSHHWDEKTYISYGDWLAAPREAKYFTGERIVFREILGKTLISTILTEDIKIDRSLYIALPKNESVNIYYVDGILNSVLMSTYFRYSNNEFDDLFPKMRVAEFRELPIKLADEQTQNSIAELVKKMLSLNEQIQKKCEKFISRVRDNLKPSKISSALESFYAFSFAEFVKELGKQKIKLSLKEQDEWEDYFDEYKAEISALKAEADKTDKAINAAVYALYGLSAEEIAAVEGK